MNAKGLARNMRDEFGRQLLSDDEIGAIGSLDELLSEPEREELRSDLARIAAVLRPCWWKEPR